MMVLFLQIGILVTIGVTHTCSAHHPPVCITCVSHTAEALSNATGKNGLQTHTSSMLIDSVPGRRSKMPQKSLAHKNVSEIISLYALVVYTREVFFFKSYS